MLDLLAILPPPNDLEDALRLAVVLAIPVSAILGIAAWATVVGHAKQRRLEREAYYRGELNKKLAEEGRLSVTELLSAREDELRQQWLKRREAFKGAGIVIAALGLAMVAGMGAAGEEEALIAGFVPMFLGGALLGYGTLLYPSWSSVRGRHEQRDGGPKST